MLDAEPIAAGGDRTRQLPVSTCERGGKLISRTKLLGDLRECALVRADVLGQAALRRVAAEQRPEREYPPRKETSPEYNTLAMSLFCWQDVQAIAMP